MTNLDTNHDPEQPADPARRSLLKGILSGTAVVGFAGLGLTSEAQAKGGFGTNRAPTIQATKDAKGMQERAREIGIKDYAKQIKAGYREKGYDLTDAQAIELGTEAWDKKHPK